MNEAKTTTAGTGNRGARRLQEAFRRARAEGRAALIPYVTAGDPSLEATKALVPALVRAGADIVEIGMPYSDPLADGPTIQRSGQRALARGTTRRDALDAAAAVRAAGVTAPIVLLAYYNAIYRRGEVPFVAEAAEAGIDGLITPDLPPEESGSLRKAADEAGVALVPLAAPTSTEARLRLIAEAARGFVYCVSVTGVTGARGQLSQSVPQFLDRVRRAVGPNTPLALGFGISGPEQAKAAARDADGVIVGSALVEAMEGAPSPEEGVARAVSFLRDMRAALESPDMRAAAT